MQNAEARGTIAIWACTKQTLGVQIRAQLDRRKVAIAAQQGLSQELHRGEQRLQLERCGCRWRLQGDYTAFSEMPLRLIRVYTLFLSRRQGSVSDVKAQCTQ